jgi:16S rRNA (cytosine1402-N4)-methyltransferase
MIHKPVLLKELIDNLNLKPGMTVVDGTLGAGGHSAAVLKKILPGGKLISIDWDKIAVKEFDHLLREKGIAVSANKEKVKMQSANGRIHLAEERRRESSVPVISNAYGEIISPLALKPLFSGDKIVGYWCGANDNYANLDKIIKSLGINAVNAIFLDLGFSSDQIDDPQRGFSFRKNGPLDMRYSAKENKTAADAVNGYPERELERIFKEYGEERFAGRIAKRIGQERKIRSIKTVNELVSIIAKAVPQSYKNGRIYPVKSRKAGLRFGGAFYRVNFATRIFQALRIETNQELENLRKFLDEASKTIARGGRLAVISFHSLEDRIVKNFFQRESRDCICPMNYLKCVCEHTAKIKIITKKPIIPDISEIRSNPRARSAKLRIAEII